MTLPFLICVLSCHDHYRRYFSRPPEENSLSAGTHFLAWPWLFRPGSSGPGPDCPQVTPNGNSAGQVRRVTIIGSSFGTRVLLTTGCTAAPSASRRCQRAAIALSNSSDSVQANPSPIQFLMPCPNGKKDARRSVLV